MSAIKRFWARAQVRQTTQLSNDAWIVLALVVLAIAVRVPGIARPLLGNFATKNVVYAMAARNWAHDESSLWYPALDCLQDDHLALHMLELPVSAYAAGAFWWLFGGSLDVWGRLVSVAFSAGSVALMFWLVRRKHATSVAAVAGASLALAPVSVIYGQAFMLEASLMFFTLAAVYAADCWSEHPRLVTLLWLSAALAAALLTKIYLLVLLLPIGWAMGRAIVLGRASRAHNALALVMLVAAVLPAGLWCVHVARLATPGHPLADQMFYSLADSAAAHRPPHPLLFEHRFYLQLARDLPSVVLTPVGLLLALWGATRREARPWWPWLVACSVLVVLLPRKFFEMNYYYLAILPPLCVLVGLGWQEMRRRFPDRRVALTMALIAALCSVRYFARPAFSTPLEDRGVLAAADVVRARTTPHERVATMHGSTFDLLYYCDRKGWFLAPDDPQLLDKLEACRRGGARLLAVAETSPDDTRRLAWLRCLERGPGFAVYELKERTDALAAQSRERRQNGL